LVNPDSIIKNLLNFGVLFKKMSEPVISVTPLSFPWPTMDPFIFCVHHLDRYPAGNGDFGPSVSLEGRNIGQDFTIKDGWRMYHGSKVPGFPAHPHSGFETVTIARQGFIDHSDSLGAAGRFGEGDVQWMTAGRGVQHCEMFPLIHTDKPNTAELFQIWLNLPAVSKSVPAHFKMLWADSVPKVTIADSRGKNTHLEIIAGSFNGHRAPAPNPDSWAANSDNEVAIWTLRMEAGAVIELPVASDRAKRCLYFFDGESVTISGQNFVPGYRIQVHASEVTKIENGPQECQFLLLQGVPIGEPVVQYGPFVANTQEEIRQILSSYQRTQFGGWPWPEYDNVHREATGKFAKYPDGRIEVPA